MAASRVDSSGSRTLRLCVRYRTFFVAAGITLGLQLFLCHSFLRINLRAGDSDIYKKDGSGKVPFSKDNEEPLNKRAVLANDKTITANGGKGPPVFKDADSKHLQKAPGRQPRQGAVHVGDIPAPIHFVPEKEAMGGANKVGGQQVRFTPACDVGAKDVKSAISRAKSVQCKQEIADVFCEQEAGRLYSQSLPNFCPRKGTDSGHYYGCYRDASSHRDLDGGMEELVNNSPQACIDHCFRSGLKYAGLQFGKECWCGNQFGQHGARLEENHCESKCPGNSSQTCGAYLSNRVFGTGVQEIKREDAPLKHRVLNGTEQRVKIVFVLTVNGRAIRQVARLLRVIYSPDHFYYIHVDKRQEFLYRELLPLQERLPNVMLTLQRFSTIWGGASLLQAHLAFLTELFQKRADWDWDYYINLSESDYPVKSVTDLTEYLTAYKGINFLRSFGKNVPRFIKKQGLDQTFHECENHLWRVGPRPLPSGVVFDGGSDWIGLWREFAHYAVFSEDELVTGLKQYYKYSLLPVESYFHMVLQNSKFCGQSTDNNLHLTNWRRKQGCKCQYKHVVDWCGCSPNDLKITDIERLISFDKKPMFFARKFEAIVDQAVINMVDKTLHGYLYGGMPAQKSYWQNVYHHLDKSTRVSDAALTLYTSAMRRSMTFISQTGSDCFPGSDPLTPVKLLEASIYNEADHFHGILTLFTAAVKATNQILTVETLVHPKQYYTVIDAKGAGRRLRSLEVGTDFDMKELIFRNYGNLIGPYDEISLRHEWGPGNELTASLAWVDPTNVVAASYDVHIPSSHYVSHQRPLLRNPLRPGIWTACVMIDLYLVARVQFLVTPLTLLKGMPIAASKALEAHSGPRGDQYTSTDFSEFLPNLGLTQSVEISEEARTNSRLSGRDLDQWVDQLAQLFWPLQLACVVGGSPVPKCVALPQCQDVHWSSRSPDPKSDLRYVGDKLPVHLPPDR